MHPKKDFEPRLTEQERRTSRNVSIKTVLAERLAAEYPSAGEWAGYLQPIRYVITPTQAYRDVSPAPGWSR
jgi:crotonobetainyl-CoA:carnitine CoA-transferase CaiB-like acyl-CoA transferase